ncbi:MAG TPA: phosphate ABC transporter permease subunit PstC, partial [Clostridia bacterium]|nr:phosphate ABC transporter permease subunit PstC [Clostridia bacterium]
MRQRKGVRRAKSYLFDTAVHLFAALGIITAVGIVIFLMLGALPALLQLGAEFMFKTHWSPQQGQYGIMSMLACSAAACFSAVALALPVALLGAACAKNLFPSELKSAVRQLGLVLCGLPTVIFGLLGLTVVMPWLLRVMPRQMAKSGGASLFTVIVVLAVMLLPTLFISCLDALEQAGKAVDAASLALGATVTQTVFCAELPAIRRQILKNGAAGIQRALCEAMAVLMVSGNVVRMPALFKSARLLASGMVLEMGYASGVHRGALFTIGLVLLV